MSAVEPSDTPDRVVEKLDVAGPMTQPELRQLAALLRRWMDQQRPRGSIRLHIKELYNQITDAVETAPEHPEPKQEKLL